MDSRVEVAGKGGLLDGLFDVSVMSEYLSIQIVSFRTIRVRSQYSSQHRLRLAAMLLLKRSLNVLY